MVLHTESRQRTVLEAFHRVVVQVNVSDIYILQIQAVRVDRETMILRCNLDLIALDIENRMLAAVMSEFQLVGPATESQAENLMAQTNPKHRLLPQQIANI